MVNDISAAGFRSETHGNISFPLKIVRWFEKDIKGFLNCFSFSEHVFRPGLYNYRITKNRSLKNIHLRIDKNQNGILFIDVNNTIHLNQSASMIIKMLLDGIHPEKIRMKFDKTSGDNTGNVIQHFAALIEQIAESDSFCPVCEFPYTEKTDFFINKTAAPYKADLALTYQCNNNCSHCYNDKTRLSDKILPKEKWVKIIDRLFNAGIPHLIFTGGEPTLYDDLPFLIKHANDSGFVAGLNTNGRTMSSGEYTEKLYNSGLNHVQITLESRIPEIHNAMTNAVSFEETVKGIKNAVSSGIHTITNTTITHTNLPSVFDTIDFLYELRIKTFAMNGMIYSGCGKSIKNGLSEKELSAILPAVRDYAKDKNMKFLWYTPTEYCKLSPLKLDVGVKRCNAAEYSICVEPNGDIIPCQSLYQSAGNLLKDKWDDIWNSDLFLSFRNRCDEPEKYGMPSKCLSCSDLHICGGGCRLARENNFK